MKNNYDYSTILLEYTQKNEIPLLYASSASVYGGHGNAINEFIEKRECEAPLNVYGYSKFLFDQMVRRYFENGLSAPVVGLRYFNVYGNKEAHKGRMSSVVYHNYQEFKKHGKIKLFTGCHGYENGEQMRDFISVSDVVNVNMFFFENHLNDKEEISGIFNCGTGVARSFNDLSLATINACRQHDGMDKITLNNALTNNLIEYIPFPDDLLDKYQSYTKANMEALHSSGFNKPFLSLEDGVSEYINILKNTKNEQSNK